MKKGVLIFLGMLTGWVLVSCMVNTDLHAETSGSDATQVIGSFEGSNVYNITKISETRFTVEMRPDQPSIYSYPDHHSYWFYLKIENAKDESIQIDLLNCDWMPDHWNNYKPVYSYSIDPNELSDHNWQKVTNTSRVGSTFTFTQTYLEDTVWVALRYPYMYTYEERYVNAISGNPYVNVEVLTQSAEGRNLYSIQVTDPAHTAPKKVIFLYARGHASETDGSWLIEGIIEFLLSGDPIAATLRRETIFMLVPIVRPDASYYGRTVGMNKGLDFWREFEQAYSSKGWYLQSNEATAIYNKLVALSQTQNSMALAMNIHHPHGSEPNLWIWSGNSKFGSSEATNMHYAIRDRVLEKSFTVRNSAPGGYSGRVTSTNQFENIFEHYLIYEINMHASGSFLTLGDFDLFGEAFAKGIFDYYSGDFTDSDAPLIPTGLKVTDVKESRIILDWIASTDNVGISTRLR